MPRIQNLTMVEALKYLASFYKNGVKIVIEDEYCSICTIESKIKTIEDVRVGVDYPRALIVGVGGIYAPDETQPGGVRPIYRVCV